MSLFGSTFECQRIAVIGGASGIGAAMARKAAEAGAEVVAVGRQHPDITTETSIRGALLA